MKLYKKMNRDLGLRTQYMRLKKVWGFTATRKNMGKIYKTRTKMMSRL